MAGNAEASDRRTRLILSRRRMDLVLLPLPGEEFGTGAAQPTADEQSGLVILLGANLALELKDGRAK